MRELGMGDRACSCSPGRGYRDGLGLPNPNLPGRGYRHASFVLFLCFIFIFLASSVLRFKDRTVRVEGVIHLLTQVIAMEIQHLSITIL